MHLLSDAFLAHCIGRRARRSDVANRDMTQAQLGYSPSLESAFRIAHVFGVGIEDVFAWDAGRRERQPSMVKR